MKYFAQWMMLFGSLILLWIIGFATYFYLEIKDKKEEGQFKGAKE